MAVFGLYRSREDDAARAVRAALAMLAALEQLSVSRGVARRRGCTCGSASTPARWSSPAWPSAQAGEFLVVGDTANRAARLQAAARPGSVLLSADTAGQVRRRVRAAPGARAAAEGHRRPGRRLRRRRRRPRGFWPEARGVEGVVTRTVGREPQLASCRRPSPPWSSERARRIVTVARRGRRRQVAPGARLRHLAGPAAHRGLGAARPRLPVDPGRAERAAAQRLRRAARHPGRPTTPPGPPALARGLGPAARHGRQPAERRPETVAAWLGFALGEEGRGAVGTTDPESLRRRGSALVAAAARPARRAGAGRRAAGGPALGRLGEPGVAGGPRRRRPAAARCWCSPPPGRRCSSSGRTWGRSRPVHTRLQLDPLSERRRPEPRDRDPAAGRRRPADPGATSSCAPPTATRTTSRNWSSGWSRRASSTPAPTAGGSRRGAVRTVPRPHHPARAPAGPPGLPRGGRAHRDRRRRRRRPGLLGPGGRPPRHRRFPSRPARARSRARRPRGDLPAVALDRSPGSREFSFRHALMRDVAYEGVLRSVRRAHHALAAQWLEEAVASASGPTSTPPRSPTTTRRPGTRPPPPAGTCAPASTPPGTFAGDDALRLLDPRPGPRPEGRARRCGADVLLAQEAVLDRMGRREEQRATLDELGAEDGLDPGRRAQARLAEGRWLFFRGEYPAVPPVAEEAADLARQASRADLESDALMQGGRSLAYLNEHDAAAGAAATGRWPPPRSSATTSGAGEVLRLLAVVATNRGGNDEGLRSWTPPATSTGRSTTARARRWSPASVGALLMQAGRLDEARVASEEALEVFVETGHRYREGVMLHQPRPDRDGAGPAGRRARGRTAGAAPDRGDRRRRGGGGLAAEPGRQRTGWPGTTCSRASTWSAGWRRAASTRCPTSPPTCSPRWPPSTWPTAGSTTPSRTRPRPRRPPPTTTSRTPRPAPTCSPGWPSRTPATRPPSTSCARCRGGTPISGMEADRLESLSVLALALQDAGDARRGDGGGRADPARARRDRTSRRGAARPGPRRHPPGARGRRRPARRGRRPPGGGLPAASSPSRSGTTTCGPGSSPPR